MTDDQPIALDPHRVVALRCGGIAKITHLVTGPGLWELLGATQSLRPEPVLWTRSGKAHPDAADAKPAPEHPHDIIAIHVGDGQFAHFGSFQIPIK